MKKVFLVCTGLGNVKRGYESFTQECFDALKDNADFKLLLLKGGEVKNNNQEIVVPNIKRQSSIASLLSKLIGKETYWIEQVSFFIAMQISIIKHRPSIIYYSDFVLGTYLYQLRKFLKFKYKLLFSNGAPNGPPFSRCNYVQQLLPLYIQQAINAGEPKDKFILLPYALNIHNKNVAINKNHLRKELGLPADKKIIISVGAINSHHKRMDYVINEFASLNEDFFLVIIGNINHESSSVIELAKTVLNNNRYIILEVPNALVQKYLLASNFFVLASLHEGLPRVLPEALAAGLLPIVHDYAVTRETLLNEYGVFVNMQQQNILLQAVESVEKSQYQPSYLQAVAYKNYSWDTLKEKYNNMLVSILNTNNAV